MGIVEPAVMARAEERRQALGVAEISGESEPIGGGIMSFTAVGSWSNQACDAGMRGPVDDAEIDRLVDFYASRGVEPKIEVCPFADPSLVHGLASRGFTLRDFETVLYRPLEAEDAAPAFGPPPGVEIVRIDPRDDALARAFAEVTSLAFCPPGQTPPDHMIELTERCVRHPRTAAFAAIAGGEVIGGGAMELAHEHEGVRIASLFAGAVRADFRRRGIQQALIALRMAWGAALGANTACIHTRPGIPTERNAMRQGFIPCYTKVALAKQGEGLVPSP